MNHKQQRVLLLLSERRNRDLYEGALANGSGSGVFYVSYLDGAISPPLTRHEVEELEREGWLRRKWTDMDGCYVLRNSAFAKPEKSTPL